ncbi:Glycosyltransferase-like protein LARGE [Gigaspora margarita]|uniref:Glycosyltransferase-like protein LARGE n=1 Tax=Gigaspora margarita TaxID=4874 RepID=A0A8H3X7R1_GIGMA|nr:Glycosyltransferase-like protein LARGE [Gigaspora margarita]
MVFKHKISFNAFSMLKQTHILPISGTLPRPTFKNFAIWLFKTTIWSLAFGYLTFSVLLSSIHLFEHLDHRVNRSRKFILPINRTYELTPVNDITITTFVIQDSYDDLVRLAEAWQEFVLFLGQDTWPSPMAKDCLKQHMKLLIANDILVLPAFSFTELANDYNFPKTIDELILIHLVQHNKG